MTAWYIETVKNKGDGGIVYADTMLEARMRVAKYLASVWGCSAEQANHEIRSTKANEEKEGLTPNFYFGD